MNYWTKRAEILEKKTFQVAKKKYKEVDEAFSKAEAKIKKEIDTWYQRLADNNEITLEDAKKLLDKDELKEFKWNVDEYIKYGQENALNQKWIKELENASAKFHIRKYEAELINIKAEYEKAFNEEQKKVESAIKESYEDRYDHTAYELQKSIGIGFDVSKKDSNQIDKLIKRPWASDGKDFSERIWNKKDQIINTLQRELVNSILVGGGNKDEAIKMMTKYVKNDIKNAKYCASRLIMTECSYFASVGPKDCFKDLDVEKYEIVATLDNKTSHICQEMDGKVFDMKDYEPGITAPPFHVFCRSTTAPYFDDEEAYGERVARDHTGNVYYVPSDMTYVEWKDKQKGIENLDAKVLSNKESILNSLINIYENHRVINDLNLVPANDLTNETIQSMLRIDKLSDETISDINKALKQLGEQYDSPLFKIRTMTKEEVLESPKTFARISHNYVNDSAELQINPLRMKEYDDYVNSMKKLMDSGYAVKVKEGMEGLYVPTHEFAHSLADMVNSIPKNNYINADYSKIKSFRKEIEQKYKEYIIDIESVEKRKEILENKLLSFNERLTDNEMEELKELEKQLKDMSICKNANKNADEFMAESFVNEKLGIKDNKYSKEVVEIIDKYFKKNVNKISEKSTTNNILQNTDKNGILFRNKEYTHRKSVGNRKVIDKPTFNKLSRDIINKGGKIIVATEENGYIGLLQGNRAATMGLNVFLREDMTISEVLEERKHFLQNISGAFDKYDIVTRTIKQEIEANEYLLSVSKKYKIPPEEIEETKQLLSYYQDCKKKLEEEGKWIE